ncbi:hypothetical protein TVNIR_0450 [Thioalkalivibrio nitratireducens DSM 14787]|uniref:Uncharacterized protein n=1 Tax=Thioalkalivibrio nitratireducens (strain DSM 14787 / UNIQEM 213 / ALEN2) TaxID=1255043 RepID=L0DT30_THIND|nr:hypothetical protein TVNIR_0450 [Thioalkalivibrio nitratireducens DSM 14787]
MAGQADRHDLWCAKKSVNLDGAERVRFDEAGNGIQPMS